MHHQRQPLKFASVAKVYIYPIYAKIQKKKNEKFVIISMLCIFWFLQKEVEGDFTSQCQRICFFKLNGQQASQNDVIDSTKPLTYLNDDGAL